MVRVSGHNVFDLIFQAQIMFNKDVSNAFASGIPENELKKIHKDFMEALNVLSGDYVTITSKTKIFPTFCQL